MKKISFSKMQKNLIFGFMIVLLILSSTFAFRDYTQHKTNVISGMNNFEVKLIEDFHPATSVQLHDIIKKEVRVKNDGDITGFIRLTFKEFMEIGGTITYSTQRFMLDTNGNYVNYPTQGAANAAYPNNVASLQTEYFSGNTGWYIETKQGDINGQYGKFMAIGVSNSNMVSLDGKVNQSALAGLNHNDPNTFPEDIYTTRIWDGSNSNSELFRAYFSWMMGSKGVDYELMSVWDGLPTNKWIIDDSDQINGYVYWGQSLEPHTTTTDVLSYVQLDKQPAGAFNYYLRTKMQAVSIDDMWSDAPNKIKDLKGSATTIVISAIGNATTVIVGDSIKFNADVSGSGIVPKGVVWSIAGNSSQGTTINASSGLLVIDPSEPIGIITVTATSTYNPTVKAVYNIEVIKGYTISGVNISAAGNVNKLGIGKTLQFSATVVGSGTVAIPQDVIWSSTGGINTGTKIDANGLLSIDSNEPTTSTIKVKATSKEDSTKFSSMISIKVVSNIPTTLGATFIADGYTWIVLKEDSNGNILITTDNTAVAPLKFNSNQSQGNIYKNSNLDNQLKSFTSVLTTLKPRIQAVNIYGVENSSVLVGGQDKIAFALSESENRTLFIDDATRSSGSYYWTRSPYPTYNNIVHTVHGNGTMDGNLVDSVTIGARPAVWIDPK